LSADRRLFRQKENHIMLLLSGAGLRYNENASASGAQTERRGEAWAGEGLAWRQNLTGRSCQ
jgi:hypothetical protein